RAGAAAQEVAAVFGYPGVDIVLQVDGAGDRAAVGAIGFGAPLVMDGGECAGPPRLKPLGVVVAQGRRAEGQTVGLIPARALAAGEFGFVEAFGRVHVHFAERAGVVTGCLQTLHEGDFPRGQPRRVVDHIFHVFDAVLVGVAPGLATGAAGDADGIGDVGAGEVDAGRGQLIQVGRGDVRVAVDAQRVIALLVGGNEQDIGTGRHAASPLYFLYYISSIHGRANASDGHCVRADQDVDVGCYTDRLIFMRRGRGLGDGGEHGLGDLVERRLSADAAFDLAQHQAANGLPPVV